MDLLIKNNVECQSFYELIYQQPKYSKLLKLNNMKKILSISNLFVKRIGLVAILLATIGVGDVWAEAKTTLNVTKSPASGAGNATVATSESGIYAATQSQSTGKWYEPTGTHTYWLKAETTSTAWMWKGWYSDGALKLAALSGSTTVEDDNLFESVTKTYTATWVQPKVTGTTAGENDGTNIKLYTFGEYTDPTIGSETKSIVFTLENNDAGLIAKDGSQPENYYTEALTGSWTATAFVKESHTYTKGDQNYTYNIVYKLSGVHGANVTANIKLTSKYGGSNYTAKLNATENYTPYFNYAYTEYNYTPANPLAEGESLAQTFSVSKNCYAANNGVWSISLSADAAAKGFTLQTATDNPNATVQFEALPGMNKADLTTTLTATCTYTDASGAKVTYTQTILLSGDAGKVITIDGAEVNTMTFDIDYAASGESTQTLPFETTLTDLTTTPSNLPAGDFITYTTWVAGLTKVSASVKHNLTPGQYTPSIKYSYNNDEIYSILNIVANIRLAQPVVTATNGLGQSIDLSWQTVYGATSYIVKSGETVVATIGDDEAIATTYKVVSIGGQSLVMGTEYPFTVTAVYASNTFGNRTSDEVRATPSLPTTVSADNISALELYTGTEKYQAGHATYGKFPYREKRRIDLSAAFKDNVAAFDQLFIFGLTTGDASNNITVPTATTNSNAVTPCYIYKKSGDNYVLDQTQTIENVNVATKPSAFNITASGQKIYFTGYAPYASCGSTWNENAVFYFIGDGENVDIYLDNLQLYARPKATNGNKAGTKEYLIGDFEAAVATALANEFEIDWGNMNINVYAQGSGSAFSFHAKSDNFLPKIHLNGENILESTEGMYIYVDVNYILTFKTNVPVVQKSAPIQILHNKNTAKENNHTTLCIDDRWGEERTNGALDLADGVTVRNAPTIDLGNENTELQINGGQITLANSFPSSGDGKYTVSFAISYRKYSMMDGLANMYGLGNDQPEGKVRFNDGTINCKPLKEEYFKNNENARELYHNLTSMKCPLDTKIDGGTFNSDVLACGTTTSKGSSPKNTKGDPLCMITLPIESINTFNGTAILRDDWMDMAVANGANTNQLSYYGIASMAPEITTDEGGTPIPVVNLMLPSDQICFVDVHTTPWVMCYPQLNVTAVTNIGTKTEELGGPVPVPFLRSVDGEGLTTIKKTSKFFYGEIDPLYMISSIDSYDAPGDMTVGLRNDGLPETVTNEEDYVVYDKIYMMLPVVADQWRMFVPPFNVSNVYVVESYPETKLIEDFGSETTDKKGNVIKKIIEEDKIKSARITQAHRTLDLFYHWVFDVDVNKSTSDFWSNNKNYRPIGTYNSYGGFVKNWMDMYDTSYRPIIDQLYHYTSDPSAEYPAGKYWWDANFYLYKATSNVVAFEDNKLQMDWEEVPIVSKARNLAGNHNVIMEKGGIYVWSFPSTIENSEKQDYTKKWDYWTGKYILLEGYPTEDFDTDGDGKNDDKGQLIAGANALNSNVLVNYETTDPAFSNTAEMRGNYTFAKGSLDVVQNPFVLNNYYRGTSLDPENTETLGWSGLLDPESAHNVYVNAHELSVDLTPGQGFILPYFTSTYNQRPRSINVKTGVVTYFDDDNTTTSIPTIAGNKQMMVYNVEGGVGIIPVVAQQVSIYNAAGQLVTSEYLTDEVHISLPTGIYLIAGAQDQFKAVVK